MDGATDDTVPLQDPMIQFWYIVCPRGLFVGLLQRPHGTEVKISKRRVKFHCAQAMWQTSPDFSFLFQTLLSFDSFPRSPDSEEKHEKKGENEEKQALLQPVQPVQPVEPLLESEQPAVTKLEETQEAGVWKCCGIFLQCDA